MECGCSYWVDFEGHSHSSDIGSVCDFLDDLEKYLKGKWIDKSETVIKTKPKRYQAQILYNHGEFLIYTCDSYYAGSDFLRISDLEIPLDDICQCSIIDTFNDIVAYALHGEVTL